MVHPLKSALKIKHCTDKECRVKMAAAKNDNQNKTKPDRHIK